MGYTYQVLNTRVAQTGLSGASNDTVQVVADRANYNAKKQGSSVALYSISDTAKVISALYDLRKAGMQYQPGSVSEASAIQQVARKSNIPEFVVRVLLYEWYYALKDGKIKDDPVKSTTTSGSKSSTETSSNTGTSTGADSGEQTAEPLYKRPFVLMLGTVVLGTAAMVFLPKKKRSIAA